MALISICGRASDHTHGRDLEAYERDLDVMFALIDSGPTTPAERKRRRASIDAIIDGDRPIAITASMRAKAVTLGGDKARSDLAATTGRYWKTYRAKHPQPQRREDDRQIGIIVDPALAETLRKRGA